MMGLAPTGAEPLNYVRRAVCYTLYPLVEESAPPAKLSKAESKSPKISISRTRRLSTSLRADQDWPSTLAR